MGPAGGVEEGVAARLVRRCGMRRIVGTWGFAWMAACGAPGTAGEQRERAGHCDPQVLRAAADETAATLTTWTPARGQAPDLRAAARGVWQACPGLPEGLRRYIDVGVDHLAPGDVSSAA